MRTLATQQPKSILKRTVEDSQDKAHKTPRRHAVQRPSVSPLTDENETLSPITDGRVMFPHRSSPLHDQARASDPTKQGRRQGPSQEKTWTMNTSTTKTKTQSITASRQGRPVSRSSVDSQDRHSQGPSIGNLPSPFHNHNNNTFAPPGTKGGNKRSKPSTQLETAFTQTPNKRRRTSNEAERQNLSPIQVSPPVTSTSRRKVSLRGNRRGLLVSETYDAVNTDFHRQQEVQQVLPCRTCEDDAPEDDAPEDDASASGISRAVTRSTT